jgi:hypothetical protein
LSRTRTDGIVSFDDCVKRTIHRGFYEFLRLPREILVT